MILLDSSSSSSSTLGQLLTPFQQSIKHLTIKYIETEIRQLSAARLCYKPRAQTKTNLWDWKAEATFSKCFFNCNVPLKISRKFTSVKSPGIFPLLHEQWRKNKKLKIFQRYKGWFHFQNKCYINAILFFLYFWALMQKLPKNYFPHTAMLVKLSFIYWFICSIPKVSHLAALVWKILELCGYTN